MPTFFNHLLEPVVLVTKGRGRESFDDTRLLFARLAELPALRDSILQIDHGQKTLAADSIAALETLLWLEGFVTFQRASKRRGNPFSRFGTRWSWVFLSEYLGFDWREKGTDGR